MGCGGSKEAPKKGDTATVANTTAPDAEELFKKVRAACRGYGGRQVCALIFFLRCAG